LVDTSQRDTVNFEGAGNHEEATFELLEEHSPLSAEATSKDDDNSPRGQSGAQARGTMGFARLLGLGLNLSGIKTGCLVHGNKTLATVLGTADLMIK
jgi:hypothetical protein